MKVLVPLPDTDFDQTGIGDVRRAGEVGGPEAKQFTAAVGGRRPGFPGHRADVIRTGGESRETVFACVVGALKPRGDAGNDQLLASFDEPERRLQLFGEWLRGQGTARFSSRPLGP